MYTTIPEIRCGKRSERLEKAAADPSEPRSRSCYYYYYYDY